MAYRKHIALTIVLAMCFLFFGRTQNLVPNWSYENFSLCPTSVQWMSGNYVSPWVDICPTVDYYNSCATIGSQVNVPNSYYGFQYARTGNAFIGLMTYHPNPNFREMVQVRLDSTLRAGVQYCVRFFVNFPGDTFMYATNKIGAFLSDTSVVPYSFSNPYPYLLPYIPQIQYSGPPITDTVNWIEISGTYTASGNEDYLTIGNFEYDSLTTIAVYDSSAPAPYAYYYIDDISVVDCLIGIQESTSPTASIFPNPSEGIINVLTPIKTELELRFYNAIGQVVLSQSFREEVSIDASKLSKGLYHILITDSEGKVVNTRKIILE
jgi:hypothetical protein